MQLPPLVFVTIARPQSAIRLIESIRAYYPSMPVHMIEQVDGPSELEAVCRDHDVTRTAVPFDTGLSVCRNLAVDQIESDYVIIADDDFVFTEHTQWDMALRFLAAHEEVVFLGGQLDPLPTIERQLAFSRARNLVIDETGRGLLLIPATGFPDSAVTFEGETFHFCDMVPHWGIAKTSVLKQVRWDERFRIGGEHEDFFLRLKQELPGSKVAYSSCIRAEHRRNTNEIYEALRKRDDWIDLFSKKWNLEYMLPVGGSLRFFKNYGPSVVLWRY